MQVPLQPLLRHYSRVLIFFLSKPPCLLVKPILDLWPHWMPQHDLLLLCTMVPATEPYVDTYPSAGVHSLSTPLTQWSPWAPTQTGFTLSSNTCRADEVSPEMFKGELSKPLFQSKKEGLRIYCSNITSLICISKHWFIYHKFISSFNKSHQHIHIATE